MLSGLLSPMLSVLVDRIHEHFGLVGERRTTVELMHGLRGQRNSITQSCAARVAYSPYSRNTSKPASTVHTQRVDNALLLPKPACCIAIGGSKIS
jgi:hypothetical protein